MEELLRQAFQLGQQWVQDMNNDKEPKNFNEWYASDEVQQQVKNCSIPAVVGRSEQLSCGRNITTCVFYKEGGKCSNLEYCRDQTT